MIQLTMTQDQFNAKAAALKTQFGVAVSGFTGQLTKNGTTVNWLYDAAKNLLTLNVVQKPFFVPITIIEAQIRSWFGS